MSPRPHWPNNLTPPPRYTQCWRCGIDKQPANQPRLCRDCWPIVRTEEQHIWTPA